MVPAHIPAFVRHTLQHDDDAVTLDHGKRRRLAEQAHEVKPQLVSIPFSRPFDVFDQQVRRDSEDSARGCDWHLLAPGQVVLLGWSLMIMLGAVIGRSGAVEESAIVCRIRSKSFQAPAASSPLAW